MSSKKNLIKNAFALSLQKIITVLNQLLLVPFFISAWGAEYYGEWLTLTIIPSVLMFANMGFGTAAANTLVLRYTSGNKQGAADICKSGLWMTTCIVTVSIFISTTVLFVLNYLNVFEKLIIEPRDVIISLALMMSARLLNFFRQFHEGFFLAMKRASLSMQLINIYHLLNLTGGILVLTFGGTVTDFASVTFFIALLFNFTYSLIGHSLLDLNEMKTAKIYKKDLIKTYKTGFGYLMNPLWQSIYFQGTTFVVRIVLGPGAVVVFNTVRTLSRTTNQINNIISGSVFPELQYMIGKRKLEKIRKLFRISILISLTTSLTGMLLLFLFGLWFYKIWTGKEINPPETMWNIFILGIGFNALWSSSSFIFNAFNKPSLFSKIGVIASILSVSATYFFTNFWNLEGAALGSIILDMTLAFYAFPKSCKLIGQPIKKLPFEFIYHDLKDLKNLFIRK